MTIEEKRTAALRMAGHDRHPIPAVAFASAHQAYSLAAAHMMQLQTQAWDWSAIGGRVQSYMATHTAGLLAAVARRLAIDICGLDRDLAMDVIEAEYRSACEAFPPFVDAHEGLAVIMEEMDELKAEVWKSPSKRDLRAMGREAIQVAAMCVRFIVDCCEGGAQ